MTQFWIAALALGLAAAAFVLVPVIRAWAAQQADRSSSALGVGIVVALAVPVVAIMLYTRWTTWDWATGGLVSGTDESAMHELDQAMAALEQRLQRNPEDLESWMLLGRSYMSMRQFGEAARAYRQAAVLTGQNNPEILADLGEALALSDPDGLQGESGAIFERVLAMNPSNPKGLWYGGLNAYESFQWELADQRLSQLLTMNPPPSLVPLIEERIASARTHTTGTAAPMEIVPAPQEQDAEPEAPPPVTATPPAAAADSIQLEVDLDPAFAGRVPGATPVFIIARNAAGGPPLAVIRANAGELPMSVRLSDANAMMDGVTLMDQPELELIARVSLSGSPAQNPGDLFGAVNYARGNSGPTRITINRVAE
jgi:cytochrome c-type biogenesis protein CcmH